MSDKLSVVPHAPTTEISGSQMQLDPVSGYRVFVPPFALPMRNGKPDEVDWRVMEVRRLTGFCPAKKVKFLETYRKTFPNMAKAAEIIGTQVLTIKRHLLVDIKFHKEFEHLMAEMREKTLQRFDDMGANPKCFMDRIALAKVMFPETFDKDKRVILAHESATNPEVSKRRFDAMNEAIDADVVQAQFSPLELEERKAGTISENSEESV